MDALLAPDEVPAVEVRERGEPFVLVCEHASNRLPRSLGCLGLSPVDLDRHIAFDPATVQATERMAKRMYASTLQRFSRLAIDCNRDPALPDTIAMLSKDIEILGNIGLSPEAACDDRGQDGPLGDVRDISTWTQRPCEAPVESAGSVELFPASAGI